MKKIRLRLISGMLAFLMFFLSVSELGMTVRAEDYNPAVTQDEVNDVTSVSDNEVVVTFDVNGGEAIFSSKVIVEKGKTLAESGYEILPTTTKKGYDLAGWFMEDGKEFKLDTVVNAYMTVTAKWTKALKYDNHKVIYVLNGGSVDGDEKFNEGSEFELPIPKRPGYGFEGWYLSENLNDASKVTVIEKGTKNDVTVYAKWKAYKYTVSFNGGDDAKGPDRSQVFTYDEPQILRKNMFKKMGYKFKSWSVSSNMIQKYLDSEEVVNVIVPEYDGQCVELIADWTKDSDKAEYFVKYYNVYDGKTVVPFTEKEKGKYKVREVYQYNTLLPMPDAGMMKKNTGYTFGGWYTDKNCKRKLKVKANMNKNLKIYAKWTTWNYKISFNKTSGKGKRSPMQVKYGQDVTVSGNTFYKKGYTFGGWSSSAKLAKKGHVVVNEGDSVKDYIEKNIYKDKQKLRIYAVWIPNTYKINYVTGVGTVVNAMEEYTAGSKYKYADIKNKTTIEDLPSYLSYEKNFKGWFLNKAYTKKGTISKKAYGDINMYAKWKFKYTVTFDKNFEGSTSGEMPDWEYSYNEKKSIKKNKFTRKGYSFLGWAVVSSNGCSIKTGVSANSVSENDIVFVNKQKITNFDFDYFTIEHGQPVLHLVAVWGKDATIKLVTNGGTLAEKNGVSFNGTDYYLTFQPGKTIMSTEQLNSIHVPEKQSYNFTGWYLDPEFKKPASITDLTAGGTTFYADWTGKSYTFEYHSNDGKGKVKKQTRYYGKSKALKKNPFKKKGYVFKGWAVSENGAPVFSNKEVVNFTEKAVSSNYMEGNTVSKTFDLYAVWEPIQYQVILYDMDLGESYIYTYTIDTGFRIREVEEDLQKMYPEDEYALKGIYKNKKLTKFAPDIPAGKVGSKKAKIYYVGWNYER